MEFSPPVEAPEGPNVSRSWSMLTIEAEMIEFGK
jgi:hypothetical protein